MNPIPEFNLNFKKEEDKILIIIEVFAGEQTPYYYSGDGMLTAFIRIGNQSVQATPQQFSELVLKGSIIILLQEGLAFVKRHSHKKWQKTSDGRAFILRLAAYTSSEFAKLLFEKFLPLD